MENVKLLNDAFVAAGKAYGGNTGTFDLGRGDHFGILPKFGYLDADGTLRGEYLNNQMYLRRNIIPICLTHPRGFDFLPESELLIKAFKAIVESETTKIEGLNSSLTIDTDSYQIGADGSIQEEATNVTRARSEPKFSYVERYGKAFTNFFEMYARYLIMDETIKVPLVSKYIDKNTYNNVLHGIYSLDFSTFAMLFIEPDPLMRKATDAWLCFNMFFKSVPERTGSRDITSGSGKMDISIDTGGAITMIGKQVLKLADTMLDKLDVLRSIPEDDHQLPIAEVSSTIASYKSTGFESKQKAS